MCILLFKLNKRLNWKTHFAKYNVYIFTGFQSSHKSLRASSFNPIPFPFLRPASDKKNRISLELII